MDPIEEGNKVCAEIVHILYSKQIKYLKSEGLWYVFKDLCYRSSMSQYIKKELILLIYLKFLLVFLFNVLSLYYFSLLSEAR